MGAQQIHIAGKHLRRIVFCNGHHRFPELLSAIVSFKEIQYSGAEGVVHTGIQFPICKITPANIVGNLVGSVLPNLANEQSVRLDFTDPVFQAQHKSVRQLIHHIQPETVSAQM